MQRVKTSVRSGFTWLLVLGLIVLGTTSCKSRHRPVRRPQADLDPGWPKAHVPWRQTTVLQASWAQNKRFWQPVSYPALQVDSAGIEGAALLGRDEFCATCHELYVKAFANNVHRQQGCEACHGPASHHLESRGEEPGAILSLKTQNTTWAGLPITPAQRSEICLRCHEQEPHAPGATWRTSSHAHHEVACTDCHTSHYNVPPGTPSTLLGAHDARPPVAHVTQTDFQSPLLQSPSLQGSSGGTLHVLVSATPDVCYRCHQEMQRFEQVVHPHQIGDQFDCTTCHDPHGNVKPETRRDACLKCHTGPHMNEWPGSPHEAAGVACTDCHNPHPKAGLPMSVDQPGVCYRCHSEKRDLQEIAHPHQILGPNGHNCTTCHRPHGRVTSETRTDVCLHCHKGAPTMAWHSSIHSREGVACADCHNAHPETKVPQVVAVSHTSVKRRKRMPMCVDEPEVCYKCHAKIVGLVSLPSHHPIKEGKMVCSDCHDGHGEGKGNLKADSLNELCYECHAEKEGPFVWEHPPVTENCAYCHEPHGTVANNLLRQPTTFLCLRCHPGHSTHNASDQCLRCHFVDDEFFHVAGGPLDPTIPTTPSMRQALFTDCTQCHSQIHGSDSPSGFECGHGMRR